MKPDLVFSITPAMLRIFHFLLQQGVRLKGPVGVSIRDFIVNQTGSPPEEIEEKIQTVFLNGRVVDELTTAIITDGSLLALSGALPGLVGATMRRGGVYSSFRNPITFHSETDDQVRQDGTMVLKLFNILLSDFGPGVLAKGFWIEQSQLQDFLKRNESEWGDDCLVRDDQGKEIPCRDFSISFLNEPDKYFFVQVALR